MNSDTPTPFTATARHYLNLGWSPLPVTGTKHGIPKGYTGHNGADVQSTDVEAWINAGSGPNIALRLPADVIALDVDDYGDKQGGATFARLIGELGALPHTFVATARDEPSGKYLFRVPPGTRLWTSAGPGVDIVQHHHRYVIAPPSAHHTGTTTQWLDSHSWEPLAEPPEVGDIPELPWAWIEYLSASGHGAAADPSSLEDVERWEAAATATAAPARLEALLDHVRARINGNHHDTMLLALCTAAREASAGCYPAAEALAALREIWNESTDPSRAMEFDSMLQWAHGQLRTDESQQQVDALRRTLAVVPSPALQLPPNAWINDSLMAETFAQFIRHRYLYIAKLGIWRRWEGHVWAEDATESIYETARQWVHLVYAEFLRAGAPAGTLSAVQQFMSAPRLNRIVELVRRIDGVAATIGEFDCDPDLLNTHNGIVDLRTGVLLPSDPTYRMTKSTACGYRPDAHHADVSAAWAAIPEDAAPWVQRFLGYCATGHTREDVIVFFDGTGANGKTTLLEAVHAALGSYAQVAPSKLVMQGSREDHPTLFADLQGVRFISISETEEGGSLRMERLKALTGGEPIRARRMRQDYFEFLPTHSIVVATNNRPEAAANDYAAWRRLRLVPFPNTYAEPGAGPPGSLPADRMLRGRLRTGLEQREAMLALIVEGAVRWYSEGLGSNPAVDAATRKWRDSEDTVGSFVAEAVTFLEHGSVGGSDLYEAYQQYCSDRGAKPRGNNAFAKQFLEHPSVVANSVEKSHVAGRVVYRRLELRSDCP